MTRKSKREIERAVDELSPGVDQGDRPEPLDVGTKVALADLFDVDPWAPGPSDAKRHLADLKEDGSR